jgi:hypothetical protein
VIRFRPKATPKGIPWGVRVPIRLEQPFVVASLVADMVKVEASSKYGRPLSFSGKLVDEATQAGPDPELFV